jgi:P4 family phage/plasmid primase-like protien
MTDAFTSYMRHPLNKFMEERRVASGKGNELSMTGLGELKGSWNIPDKDYPRFLDLLNDFLFVKNNRPLGFVEQPRAETQKPFLIDLDFKYPKELSLNHAFTSVQIEDFCKTLQRAMSTFFDLSSYPSLRFFVLLRPSAYQSAGFVKDGIHIECPDFTLTNDKWNVLRQWMLRESVIQRIFGSTGYLNQEADIYDRAMGGKQGWMFYGASKPSILPYKVEMIKVYNPESDEWTLEEPTKYSSRQLLEILSIRYKVEDECGDVIPEKKEEYDQLLRLSRGGGPTSPPLGAATSTAIVPAMESVTQNVQAILSSIPYSDETRVLVGRLVRECLNSERADHYETWIRVGWCLHNLEPSQEMFDLWMDFSAKSPKATFNNMGQLRRDWFHGMRKDSDGPRLTLRSLHKWARDDNREQYDLIINEDILEYIIKKVKDNTHYHVAQLMEQMFQTTYVASIAQRSTEWFQYDEILNMWKHLNQGIELKRKICFDVAKKVEHACERVHDQMKQIKKDDDAEKYLKKLEELHKLQAKLYNVGFLDQVMKMASIFFADEDFVKKLNINPYLVGFANGILELRYKDSATSKPRCLFRQGKPEDYVSFLCGRQEGEMDAISYRPYDPTDPKIPEIMSFFDKLFPQVELRDYVLRLMSSTLEGSNPEQCYYIFTGRGSNGKSKLVELMRLTLGDYITSIQSTVLTRKRPDSGAANPDVIVAKNRRFIYMQEPDAKEPLNTSRMKQFSGEDMVEARGLFQDQEKFKIMGKLFMMCNDLPPIYSMDNGTWRRIKVVPFISTFRDADHADWKLKKPNIHLKDEFLDIKLKEWRESFLSLLVHIYETQYLVNGLHPIPAVVNQASDSYKESFDVFSKFCHERIRREDNNRVDFKDLRRIFQQWRKENSVKANLTDTELWNRCLDSSDIGKLDSKKQVLVHIRLFSTDEEVEAYDEDEDSGDEVDE